MRIRWQVLAMILVLGAARAYAYDSAGNDNPVRTRFVVKFDDLNLDKEHDAQIMLKRIELAARTACGGHPSFSTYTGGLERSFYECRDRAVRQAVEQLRAPKVGRLYEQAAVQRSAP